MSFEIHPEWSLKKSKGAKVSLPLLLSLLTSIRDSGSISRAAASEKLSYRHAWGMLRDFELEFSAPLLLKSRGKGTSLTPLAEKLIWADKRITARITPILESFASELEAILTRASTALRITASHGFAVEALIQRLGSDNVPVEINYRSSLEAVAALSHDECDLAGFHVPVGEFKHAAQPYLKWLDPRQHALIHLAYRSQGLFIAKGNPKKIRGLIDLQRKDLRFVNRQTGSGTKILLELLLAKENIDSKDIADYDIAEYTHSAVAAYVASDMADVGFGVETAARRFDLDFIPVVRENYFFACKASALSQSQLKSTRAIMLSTSFRDSVNVLAGYDGKQSGSMVTFEDAFS
ncbi:MAG: putative molybdenum-binding protein [Candidatus Gallionella acididurans]|uniref:Putative molybdenum-binding protein n=1 Tax=Candidatus Gallionella acididurans TaxID=1796491 RepID=A0A139BVG4_9PROT|nr:MAG: putative molybdenum-binding protein [Candidatus Gallionella acididurans]